MLFPRFTLRVWIVGLVVGSVIAVVLREAVLGRAWATGAAIGMGSIVLSLAIQAAAFGLSLALSRRRPPGSGA